MVLLCVVVLLKPFDCFSSAQFTRKAADCCQKGKCTPSRDADDCCKGTLPSGVRLVASKAPHYSAQAAELITAAQPVLPAPEPVATTRIDPAPSSDSPPGFHFTLPLLI